MPRFTGKRILITGAPRLFLPSDDSSYVTASQYSVDGGLTKR